MTKSGSVRLIILILFFLFMILYVMQLTGYNEYNQNRKNMLTEAELKAFEKDVQDGKDVAAKDYLEGEKKYGNKISAIGLSISKGIENIFNESMNAFFKMMEEAAKKE